MPTQPDRDRLWLIVLSKAFFVKPSSRLHASLAILLSAFCGGLAVTIPGSAQPTINVSGASNCTTADFDANVGFLNGPSGSFSILVEKRNISNHPCVMDGPEYGASLMPDRAAGSAPFGNCYYCDERLPNGQSPAVFPVTVSPGQIVSQIFRWKTVPTSPDLPCVQLQAVANPVLVVAPSLLKQVCSDVEVSHFRLGSPSEPVKKPNQSAAAFAFQLTAPRDRYDEGEHFSVLLTPIQPGAAITPQKDRCPTFYLRERSPDGETRMDEVQPISSVGCPRFIPGRRKIASPNSFELDSGAGSRWSGIGEHSFQILQLSGSPDDSEVHFIASNVLLLQIVDPAAIQRKWGPRTKGVAADVTIDKETFAIREDVPLHIAVENFEAPVTIYSIDPVWDPWAVAVQVRDAAGHILPVDERFQDLDLKTGHGFGPRPVEKGKLIPIESTLAAEGWLPNRPGTYIVEVIWAPCTGPDPDSPESTLARSGSRAAKVRLPTLRPYAVVQATATIHIVGRAESP